MKKILIYIITLILFISPVLSALVVDAPPVSPLARTTTSNGGWGELIRMKQTLTLVNITKDVNTNPVYAYVYNSNGVSRGSLIAQSPFNENNANFSIILTKDNYYWIVGNTPTGNWQIAYSRCEDISNCLGGYPINSTYVNYTKAIEIGNLYTDGWQVITQLTFDQIIENTLIANFSYDPFSPIEKQSIHFIDNSISTYNITNWNWNFGDNTTSTSKNPYHIYNIQGIYNVNLTITNINGNQTSIIKQLTVLDSVPTAFAGSDQMVTEGDIVYFSGSGSGIDQPLNYSWDFGDGNIQNGIGLTNPSHIYTQNGIYNVTLTITDSDGSQAYSSLLIIVDDTNPVILLTFADKYFTSEGSQIQFSSSASSTYDSPVSYSWDFGDFSTSEEQNPIHIYTYQGMYIAKLIVTDSDGSINSTTLTILITDTVPSANAGENRIAVINSALNFDAGNSTGYDQPLTYMWDFENDGNIDTSGITTSHVYTSLGVYHVKLIVIDNDLDISENVINVSVRENNVPIVLDIPDVNLNENTISNLNLNDYVSDPDNDLLIISYNGNTNIDVAIDSNNNVTFTPNQDWIGQETITFTACDFEPLCSSKNVLVTVNAVNHAPTIDSYSPELNFVMSEGTSQLFRVNTSDGDNDILNYYWYLNNNFILIESNFTFSPDYNQTGNYSLKCEVSDGQLNNSIEWNINVNNTNRIPIIDFFSPELDYHYPEFESFIINEGVSQLFNISSSDLDGDLINYSWYLNGNLISNINEFMFSPNYTQSGNYLLEAIIYDSESNNEIMWNISVNNVNQAPVITSYYPNLEQLNITLGDIVNFNVSAYDPDGDNLLKYWVIAPTYEILFGSYNYTYNFNIIGNYKIDFNVTDDYDSVATKSWNIIVNPTIEPINQEMRIFVDGSNIANTTFNGYNDNGNYFGILNRYSQGSVGRILFWKVKFPESNITLNINYTDNICKVYNMTEIQNRSDWNDTKKIIHLNENEYISGICNFDIISGILLINTTEANLTTNVDRDSDEYTEKIFGGNDCNDNDNSINPGATEICGDEIDQNCDDIDLVCENTAPIISGLPDQTWSENSSLHNDVILLPTYTFDAETSPNLLTYTITEQTNLGLVNCTVDDSKNIDCIVTDSLTGVSDVTVQVSDDNLTAQDIFRITISSVPTEQTIINSIIYGIYYPLEFWWNIPRIKNSIIINSNISGIVANYINNSNMTYVDLTLIFNGSIAPEINNCVLIGNATQRLTYTSSNCVNIYIDG